MAKGLELQHQSFQRIFRTDLLSDGLVGSPCSPRDSQESSPTPQFQSINSSALSFHYGPALTSVHDHWKNISQRVSVYFHRISLTEWMQCSKCYVSNVVWETTLCLRLRSRDHFLIRVHGIPVSEVESPGYPGSHCPRQQQGTIW